MSEVVWIEASPRVAATAAPVAVLLAGGGRDMPYRHPVDGRQFRAGVTRRPLFSARLGFDESGWNGSTRPQTSVVSFATADRAFRDTLAGLVWKDAPVTIDVGAQGTVPVRVLVGKIQEVEFTLAGLTLTIIDLSERLERPLAPDRFAGTGGIEGPAEAKGRVKRRSFGYVFNVEGRLINAAHSIYEFGDPARPLTGWTALRDKGRGGAFTTLGWQGSIDATLAALIASNPARGGGVVAPSIACAKWWTQPSGPLTADLIGTAGTGGGMQPAAIADAISIAAGGPPVAGLAAAVALRGAICGVHVGSDAETFAQVIDRVLLGASLLWLPRPNGTIAIAEWAFNAGAPLLQGEFRGRTRTYPPHGTRRVGFQRNERSHSDGEIAGVLLDELVNDGAQLAVEDVLNSHQEWTDVQNSLGLRPQDNATYGAAWGLSLTGRPGNLAALVGSEGVRNDLISIGSNGALLGGAGGQVTIGGLGFAGDLDAQRNSRIFINDGYIYGISNPRIVDNSYVSLNGVQLSAGYGDRGAVANTGISMAANGALLGGAGGQVTLAGIDGPGVIGRTALLSAASGRVLNPTFYNTQALLGPRNATSLSPSYAVGSSNVTVNLPAHIRVVAGASGPVTLSYGATSGVVAFSSNWWAYIDDPALTGFASPAVAFTDNPANLLHPGRYEVASGRSPDAGGSGGSTGGGGGSGGGGGGGSGYELIEY